ncbi:MAG: alpha-L-arabinofuranosidase C-terminal domain-containing protein [Planctomycetota bacterium]
MRASIVIDPYRIIGRIDPKIYGQFMCRRRWVADEGLYDPDHPDSDETGLRQVVVRAMAESAPPILRWPGGCTGTSYDWREGIGPRKDRKRTIDAHFGYDVGNGFGTAEFVAFCRRIGAEPHINLSTGLGTLRDAVEWIEYCNFTTPSRWADLRRSHGHPEPFNVRYWQIGNENHGPWEIGHHSPKEYAAIAREWGKTIKKMDPSLQVIAVGGSQKSTDWDVEVLQEAWPHIDYLTAHRYWNFDSSKGMDNYDAIAAAGHVEEQTIRAIGGLIDLVARDKKATRKPRLAFTEWNCRDASHAEMSRQWRPTDTQYRMVDALAVAGFINAMQRQCRIVGLANCAQSINVVGLLLVTTERVVRETVYWALVMQRHHSGATAVDAWVECEGYTTQFEGRPVDAPYLDVSATMDEASGRLFISIVNRHRTDEILGQVRLRDAKPAKTGLVYRLWHEDPLARNTIAEPEAIAPETSDLKAPGGDFEIALPPHSYSILELDLKG